MDMFVEKDIDDIIVGIIQSIIDDFKKWMMMMMIAFITVKSSLVPLIAGLCA